MPNSNLFPLIKIDKPKKKMKRYKKMGNILKSIIEVKVKK